MKFKNQKQDPERLNHTCRESFSHVKRFAKSAFSFLEHVFTTSCDVCHCMSVIGYDMLKPADDSKTAELECVEHSPEKQKGETIRESASDR